MSVTQDYKLLTTWRDLLAARIGFFEPLGTHTSLVREMKAELKITNELLAPVQVSSSDYTKLVLTSAERAAVAGALMSQAQDMSLRVQRSQLLGRAKEETQNSAELAAIQSAYAKVRA